jgi:hypothetical protein
MGGLERRPRSIIEILVMISSCVETQKTVDDDISSSAEQPLPGWELLYVIRISIRSKDLLQQDADQDQSSSPGYSLARTVLCMWSANWLPIQAND